VLRLAYLQLRIFLLQLVRVEEGRFVPHVLAALAEVLREVYFSFLLENVRLVVRNAVPEFGFSLMKVVNRLEVKVLLVPAKESLP
jgi:hypothetical protein